MIRNKLTFITQIAEIISAIAVVLSLIYVGIQVNQNTKATQSAIRQSVADNDITYLMTSLDNSILAVASYKVENDIELSGVEMSQLVARQHVNFRVFENAFYQYEQELLEPETWTRYRVIILSLITNNPASKKMWIQNENSFTDSFQKEIRQILNEENVITEQRPYNAKDSLGQNKD
ncbi:hypothetical protein [Lutimonas zeaxanthinifaciens]|uniref:hypothetical protein n=1 Tax=Lutimonas zeaxanthinifaciens TaxID=3060215 RepID=UPI00265CC080|nr:hypothetical protein [Lutimonas sp. YSD2104]WKK65711.1 hypothetical protein QZH61_14110 [Lutimonas sp. YSD2104]